MASRTLAGTTIVVAGAGLAGLTAARDLESRGAAVTIVEARNRVGGRVWTVREPFAARQYAEAGADLIEGEQEALRGLARELGLEPVRILRAGFGFYGVDRRGRRRVYSGPGAFEILPKLLRQEIRDFKMSEQRWDSAVAARLARTSVAEWLASARVPQHLRSAARAFRGFFLADPEDLSVLVLVEQFASSGPPGQGHIYRIPGGNDRLATAIARKLRGRVLMQAIVRRIAQTGTGVTVSIEDGKGERAELSAQYVVSTLPASTLRDVVFEPGLPPAQRAAISHLAYGSATRLLLQFDSRFWKKRGRPIAFGTDLPIGAVWDGNEQQQRSPGILSFLAGGQASGELQHVLRTEGDQGVVDRIRWLGDPARPIASKAVVWEDDPWARGGYAYFDPAFDPLWRDWLARPAGRVVFAGEHTSIRWQGYMNGAVETGRRAAAEIAALAVPEL
jgi:monoamine oxidase